MKKFFSTLRDIANINASWNAFTHHTKSWTKTCITIKHFSQLFYEKLPRWCGFLGLNIFVKKWRHSLEYQLNWICSSTSSLSSETTSSVILSLTWPHKSVECSYCVLQALRSHSFLKCMLLTAELCKACVRQNGESMLGHDWILLPNSF